MSKYIDLALERRRMLSPEGRPVYNCCQSVAAIFAQDAGYDEETCMRAAACFRGGMMMGSVCGAITGGLMALGLAGVDDSRVLNEYYRRIRENHNGMMDCRDLLRVNAEKGGEKTAHCNAMICECIGYVEEVLRERGILP